MATYSYMKKYISSITPDDGTVVTEHEQKAMALWLSYKDRLGLTEFIEIAYNLAILLQEVDLPGFDEPFSMEEILDVLKDMPSDHAPCPDGFNGAFFKKC